MEKDHLEVLLEDIRSKFDLVPEGHDMLRHDIVAAKEELREEIAITNIKIDAVHDKLDARINAVESSLKAEIQRVEKKVDAVGDDLAAHRADTESHPGLYKVKE